MKNVEKRIYRFASGLLIGMLGILSFSCTNNEDFEAFELEGSIVGFNSCSFHSNGRVGYVIVSNDHADTISTFSLSPSQLRFPAAVGTNPNRPIFSIPQNVFDQAVSTRTPEVFLEDFPIKVTYRRATQEDRESFSVLCIGVFSTLPFARGIWDEKQVVVIKASRN